MRCDAVRILMTKRLYEPLAPGDAETVTTHLGVCSRCQAENAASSAFEGRLRKARAETPDLAITRPVNVSAIFAGQARPRVALIAWPVAGAALAGAIALAMFAFRPARTPVAVVPRPREIVFPRLRELRPSPLREVRVPQPRETAPPIPAPSHLRVAESEPVRRLPVQRQAPASPPIPDDAYLDGRDLPLVMAWTNGGARELTWLSGPLPAIKDDFVTIPLGRLAAADPNSPAVADVVKAYEKEAKVVDARLFHKISLELKAASLEGFCAALQEQTRVSLKTSRGVRDEKVTVFLKDRPAREVMREVARLFGYMWSRSGEEGSYKYELLQDLRSQLTEQEMRNRDLNEALLALDEKMAGFKPYLDLSLEQAQERFGKAKGAERSQLYNFANQHWGSVQVYHRLTPGERMALASGQELRFGSDSPLPDRRLPQDWVRPLLGTWGKGWGMAWSDKLGNMVVGPADSLRQDGLNPTLLTDWPNAGVTVGLKINRSELGELSLQSDSAYFTPYKRPTDGVLSTPGAGGTAKLAVGKGPSAAKPDNGRDNRALARDPAFQKLVSLDPKPSCPKLTMKAQPPKPPMIPAPGARFRSPGRMGLPRMERTDVPHVASADVWEEVHRQTGLPIIADSYTRLLPLAPLRITKTTMFEALCRTGDQMRARWRKDGDYILARSPSFFWDKLKEVPAQQLTRWQKEKQGGLPFDDLIEMAMLPDEKLDSQMVGDAMVHCLDLPEWDLLQRPIGYYSPRPWLRLLATMAPAQRFQALKTEGLAVGSLTPEQVRELHAILDGRVEAVSPAEMAKWRFAVDYAPDGWYFYAPNTRMWRPGEVLNEARLVIGRTAEEALAAARRLYPEVSAVDIERSHGSLNLVLMTAPGSAWIVGGEPERAFAPG